MADHLQVRVLRKTREAEDIFSFELARVDGTPLPPFDAGAHIDVHAPGGFVRQYSLCNDSAGRTHYRIAVLRDAASRGGSVAMHDEVHEGDTILVSEPRNHFPLVPAQRTLLFAGGIGVTPLLCMAQRLSKLGAEFEMHYCTRSKSRTAFLEEMAASAFASRVHTHFDDGASSQRLDLSKVIAQPDPHTRLYICGPGGFMNHVVNTAKDYGWPSDQIHTEYFAAAPQDTAGDGAFDVKIASSGKTYTVPAGKTVVEVLAMAGIEILTSCEQGVCGTCITRVLDGECDHRDMILSDEEKATNALFTPCCSRARSRLLVLDL